MLSASEMVFAQEGSAELRDGRMARQERIAYTRTRRYRGRC